MCSRDVSGGATRKLGWDCANGEKQTGKGGIRVIQCSLELGSAGDDPEEAQLTGNWTTASQQGWGGLHAPALLTGAELSAIAK